MRINKKVGKMQKLTILQFASFLLKFLGIAFVGIVFVTAIVSLHVTTEHQ